MNFMTCAFQTLKLQHDTLILSFLPLLFFSAEFSTYLNYCRSLRFQDKPDYCYLRQLFRNLFHREGNSYDYVFDWNTLKIGTSGRAGGPSGGGGQLMGPDDKSRGNQGGQASQGRQNSSRGPTVGGDMRYRGYQRTGVPIPGAPTSSMLASMGGGAPMDSGDGSQRRSSGWDGGWGTSGGRMKTRTPVEMPGGVGRMGLNPPTSAYQQQQAAAAAMIVGSGSTPQNMPVGVSGTSSGPMDNGTLMAQTTGGTLPQSRLPTSSSKYRK